MIKVGDINIISLKKLLYKMEANKNIVNPVSTFSPFTRAIRTTPLPPGFKTNSDLIFNADIDSTAYLIHFNSEKDVYQVSLEARCRVFAAFLRGSD